MLLDEKSLNDFGVDDIHKLITGPVCESHRLDYKRDWWDTNDEGKREMLRDISALANAYGGYIVVGIETESGAGSGDLDCPTTLTGIDRSDYTQVVLRSCRDNFDPPCNGIEAAQIELDQYKVVVLIKVPQSLDAPHMVTFKGLNQFWQRQGTDKQRMTTFAIRETIMRRLSYRERILELVSERLASPWESDRQMLYCWAAPLAPLLTEVDVRNSDLRKALGQDLLQDPFRLNCKLHSGNPQPSLNGIEAAERDKYDAQLLGLGRNGYLEFATSKAGSDYRDQPVIVAERVAVYLENFASLAAVVYSVLESQGQLAIGCGFTNTRSYRFYTSGRHRDQIIGNAWEDWSLDLGYMLAFDLASERIAICRALNDRLWNAFQYDECPFYSTGELVIFRG